MRLLLCRLLTILIFLSVGHSQIKFKYPNAHIPKMSIRRVLSHPNETVMEQIFDHVEQYFIRHQFPLVLIRHFKLHCDGQWLSRNDTGSLFTPSLSNPVRLSRNDTGFLCPSIHRDRSLHDISLCDISLHSQLIKDIMSESVLTYTVRVIAPRLSFTMTRPYVYCGSSRRLATVTTTKSLEMEFDLMANWTLHRYRFKYPLLFLENAHFRMTVYLSSWMEFGVMYHDRERDQEQQWRRLFKVDLLRRLSHSTYEAFKASFNRFYIKLASDSTNYGLGSVEVILNGVTIYMQNSNSRWTELWNRKQSLVARMDTDSVSMYAIMKNLHILAI